MMVLFRLSARFLWWFNAEFLHGFCDGLMRFPVRVSRGFIATFCANFMVILNNLASKITTFYTMLKTRLKNHQTNLCLHALFSRLPIFFKISSF